MQSKAATHIRQNSTSENFQKKLLLEVDNTEFYDSYTQRSKEHFYKDIKKDNVEYENEKKKAKKKIVKTLSKLKKQGMVGANENVSFFGITETRYIPKDGREKALGAKFENQRQLAF